MIHRKSPIKHRVKSHRRKNRLVKSYIRGNGRPVPLILKPVVRVVEKIQNPSKTIVHTIANQIVHDLTPYCHKIEVAGSIRRGKSDPHDIDILLIPKNPEAWKKIKTYASLQKNHVRLKGDKIISFVKQGVKTDIYVTDKEHYGGMELFLTGPGGYNIGLRMLAKKKGFLLNQYGLFDRKTDKMIAGTTEESIYKALGKPYKPPELRGL